MGSRLRIKNLREEFTNSEEKIADYILEFPDEVYNMTSEELAKATKTSAASVVRFAKKLGYEGFQELKIAIAKDSIDSEEIKLETVNDEITINDDVKFIIDTLSNANIKAIKETVNSLDGKTVDIATDIIAKAKNVNIFGYGNSSIVCEELKNKLIQLNISVSYHSDPYLQIVSAINMDVEDLAIGISHSGRTENTYNLLRQAKKSGSRTISITKYGDNPISELADVNLFTTEAKKELGVETMSSRIAQLTVVDILFSNIIRKNKEKYNNIIVNNNVATDILRIKR